MGAAAVAAPTAVVLHRDVQLGSIRDMHEKGRPCSGNAAAKLVGSGSYLVAMTGGKVASRMLLHHASRGSAHPSEQRGEEFRGWGA